MVSALLGARVLTSAISVSDVSTAEPTITLADLGRGRRGIVTHVDASVDASTARRLFDLGFAPGAIITVQRKAPLADPVIFEIAGFQIALRREQAKLVGVIPG